MMPGTARRFSNAPACLKTVTRMRQGKDDRRDLRAGPVRGDHGTI